jgi:hypothetical protein
MSEKSKVGHEQLLVRIGNIDPSPVANKMAAVAYSWRKFYKVHPSAEVFQLMSQGELEALAKNIEKNGLEVPIQMRRVGTHLARMSEAFVIDGRNRLDAMEQVLGWTRLDPRRRERPMDRRAFPSTSRS